MVPSDSALRMHDDSSSLQSHEAHASRQLQTDSAEIAKESAAVTNTEGHAMHGVHDTKQELHQSSGHLHVWAENDGHHSSMQESADRHDDEDGASDNHNGLNSSATNLHAVDDVQSPGDVTSSSRTSHKLHETEANDEETNAHAMQEESEEHQYHHPQQTDHVSTDGHDDFRDYGARDHRREFDMNNCVIVPDHCSNIKDAISNAGVCSCMSQRCMPHAFVSHIQSYYACSPTNLHAHDSRETCALTHTYTHRRTLTQIHARSHTHMVNRGERIRVLVHIHLHMHTNIRILISRERTRT